MSKQHWTKRAAHGIGWLGATLAITALLWGLMALSVTWAIKKTCGLLDLFY